ncbi:hypothetical protein BT96DRAFT_949645 [Gymnopus androsaceus JB14]|uniref:Ribonuclease H1 N-terminal domain-containing protein n=1 Tax=Gymnopus androsaceus JB14 TaxID=1447944 RepID=A0A6A4GK28_9AGAR|nr:hypothetical protein BT96DRAFT_949645 [Gymnopus androsaceus JB14]
MARTFTTAAHAADSSPATFTEHVSPADRRTMSPRVSGNSRVPPPTPTSPHMPRTSRVPPASSPTSVHSPRTPRSPVGSPTHSRSIREASAPPASPSLSSALSMNTSAPEQVNGSKFYVVFAGTRIGIFGNWHGEAKLYTQGVSGSQRRSYNHWGEALAAYHDTYFGHAGAPQYNLPEYYANVTL